jgi:hypothetical protein
MIGTYCTLCLIAALLRLAGGHPPISERLGHSGELVAPRAGLLSQARGAFDPEFPVSSSTSGNSTVGGGVRCSLSAHGMGL